MRAAVFAGPRSIEVAERPDPIVKEPTDAVVRVTLACVCGSDLWYYRGDSEFAPGPIGHEFVGVVEDVGSEVRDIATGDFVIAPFAFSDGTCSHCRHGITSACANGGFFPMNGDGGQGEAVRVPLADGTLVRVSEPGDSEELMRSLLTLSDVMATGHHAAVCARVEPGDTVAVVGDGAVGLCGVLAAKRLGADRIVALSRNPSRQALAREFGATDVVEQLGEVGADGRRPAEEPLVVEEHLVERQLDAVAPRRSRPWSRAGRARTRCPSPARCRRIRVRRRRRRRRSAPSLPP